MKRTKSLVAIAVALTLTAGCARRNRELPPEPASSTQPDGDEAANDQSGVAGAAVPGSRADFIQSVPSDRILFETDSYSIDDEDRRTLDAEGDVTLDVGGWLLLRAWNDGADPLVLDIYPYATTSPIYLELPGGVPAAPEDAAYFAAWMERMVREATARNDYNTAGEHDDTIAYLRQALDRYRALARP